MDATLARGAANVHPPMPRYARKMCIFFATPNRLCGCGGALGGVARANGDKGCGREVKEDFAMMASGRVKHVDLDIHVLVRESSWAG